MALGLLGKQKRRNDDRLTIKLLVRRGSARTASGDYKNALCDYQEALKLDKTRSFPELVHDVERVGHLVRCSDLKSQADLDFRSSKFSDAMKKYDQVLNIDPKYVCCMGNRAALCLAMKDPAGCIRNATQALDLLQDVNALSGPVPDVRSIKYKQWVMRLHVRRGAGYAQLGDLHKAEIDYAAALDLFPENEKLRQDLNRIRGEKV